MTLGVGPESGERQTFARGDIELTLEMALNASGYATGDALVTAETTRPVSEEVYSLLRQRIETIVAPRDARPRESPSPRFVTIPEHKLGWFSAPHPVTSICDDIRFELHGEAARLVQLLRWVFNRLQPSSPLTGQAFRWSLDGRQWEFAPTPEDDFAPIEEGEELVLHQDGVDEILQSQLVEPVARQILIEAVSLRHENARAAYVIAFAAAEIGVKQFAVQRSQTSEAWLIKTGPSPPMAKLLREYLPRLTERRTSDRAGAVPKHLSKRFDGAMAKRNSLAHTEEPPPSTEEVAELLSSVNDLLYLLDWFAGHDWAFAHLSEETRAAYPEGAG